MATERFLNLPEKKRKLIEDVAVDEFAKYSYDQVSISRIVSRCNIAKGSFYHYFDDKEDMFAYIIQMIGEEKLRFLQPYMAKSEGESFLTILRQLYIAAIAFANNHPKYSKISNFFIRHENQQVYDRILKGVRDQAKEGYVNLLKKGIEEGSLRADIDLDYISFMLINITLSTMDYHYETKDNSTDISIDSKTLSSFDLMFDLLFNGIKRIDHEG